MNQLTDSQREALAAVLEAAKRDWDDYRAHIQDGLDYPGRVVPLVEDFVEVSARWKAHFAEVEAMLAAEPAPTPSATYCEHRDVEGRGDSPGGGGSIQVCFCGATRTYDRRLKKWSGWHICDLCRNPRSYSGEDFADVEGGVK